MMDLENDDGHELYMRLSASERACGVRLVSEKMQQ